MGILYTIFNTSINGSIIFLIFLILKPVTKKHFNSSWHYKMLILILAFFIIPVGNFIKLPINSISNIYNSKTGEIRFAENINKKSETKSSYDSTNIKTHIEDFIENDKNIDIVKIETEELQTAEFDIRNYKYILKYIWIFGLIILFLLNIIPYIKFKSYVLKNSTIIEEKSILNIFNKCKEKLRLNSKVQLRLYNNISSPMLIGIIHPIVVISDTDLDNQRLKMIFLHELNHYKRNDIIIKLLGLIINAIHWFNPLIYIILKEMDKYCEYSIDEKVVEEMDIKDRKYYGETILSLINNSMIKKASLTTNMGSSGKQLKNRLENMIYSFKTTRKKQIMSLFTAILILILGSTVACSILPVNTSEGNDSFAVYIKEDGLYYSYLNGGNEIEIHDGNSFEYPLISSEGNYIAYTMKDSLYIYSIKDKRYEKICDGMDHYYRSYDWIDDTTLIYGSNQKTGFIILNLLSNERIEHVDEYYYTGLMSSNNMVYGRKTKRLAMDDRDFADTCGIVEVNLDNYDNNKKQFSTNIIVEDRKSTEEVTGYSPIVWNISKDGRYVYIMEKPASASLSSDVIGIGVYDVKEKIHTEFTDIETLSYKNHLAINPSTNMIGLIEGAGRDMVENKKVILLDIDNDKAYSITDENFVAMTPSFTLDGKKLLYAATEAINPSTTIDYNQIYNNWEKQTYSIYEYDLKSSKVRKRVEGKNFDFMPLEISDDEILFIRDKGNDYYSFIKLDGSKEYIIADNIIFRGGKDNLNFGFYGHTHTEMGMDIFINKNKKSNKEEYIEEAKVDHLYKLKGTYIGDNSSVGNIINLLDFPEDLTLNEIELFTKEEPFGLKINFKANDEILAKYISTSSDYKWRLQSLILFSLIDNLEYIQYDISSDKAEITTSYSNRKVANSLCMKELGYRILEVSGSKKKFEKFYNIFASEYNKKTNQPEGLIGYIVIDDNTLNFREVEIVEWDNQERVKELGLSQSDFPNGYTIINKHYEDKSFELYENTIYTFTDVYELFIHQPESNRLYTTTKKDEFIKHLDEYKLNDIPLSNQTVPYFIEIKDGKVISVTEKFKYTI